MKKPEGLNKIEINLEDLEPDPTELSDSERQRIQSNAAREQGVPAPSSKVIVIEGEDLMPVDGDIIYQEPPPASGYYRANNAGTQAGFGQNRVLFRNRQLRVRRRRIILAAALVLLLLGLGTVAAIFYGGYFNGSTVATEDQATLEFSTGEGVNYHSPTGIRIDVAGITQDTEAELRLSAAVFQTPEPHGIVEVHGTYDIAIIANEELTEHPQVKLAFTVPQGLDANEMMVLFEGPDGYGLPGGSVEVTSGEIQLDVPELSRFVLVMPRNLSDVIPLIREPEETILTEEGHAQVSVKLEAVEPIIFGFGSSPWYSLSSSPGTNQLSVSAPGDWIFESITPQRSYLGPKEQKELVYTFYGTGGESSFWLSASAPEAIAMAWVDAIYRLAKGSPLPWPVGPELLKENEELALFFSLYEHLQEELQRLEGEQLRGSSAMSIAYRLMGFMWEETRSWALEKGEEFLIELLGNVWWRFGRTADMFVSQVIYAIAGETEYERGFYVRTAPQLRIEPEEVSINAGESIRFEAHLETLDGESLSYPSLGWEVSGGGSIDDGIFRSNLGAKGIYDVTVKVVIFGDGGAMDTLEKTAKVIITDTDLEPDPLPRPEPGYEQDSEPKVRPIACSNCGRDPMLSSCLTAVYDGSGRMWLKCEPRTGSCPECGKYPVSFPCGNTSCSTWR